MSDKNESKVTTNAPDSEDEKSSEQSRKNNAQAEPAEGHEPSDASKESPDYPSADRPGASNERQQLGKPSPSDADNVRVEQAGMPETYSGEAGRGQ